jgi:hypothetical protein
MSNVNAVGLKEEIKRLADEGRAQNALLAPTTGAERQAVRARKWAVGREARARLLAYALLRGVPYGSLERSTRTPSWAMRRILDEVSAIVREWDTSAAVSAHEWAGVGP